MSEQLIQILPAEGTVEKLLPDAVRTRLNALYDRVPSVSCECDRLGQCCELTKAEVEADFATMYPLYTVEYLNVVDYVRTHFDPVQQKAFLDVIEERPERCPFLTSEGGCMVHPVRPLVCRTYGVLTREEVEQVASDVRGEVPQHWIASFLYIERHTVCPHTRRLEPDKVAEHAEAMVHFQYERELIQMGREVGPLGSDRQKAWEKVTRLREVTRWTWGGFNVLMRSSSNWLRKHFKGYWDASMLGE
ncbi:MAG: YkgJ family cysteine cluster protein [bacterium]|nr:YkgJ family cysteine cluster protein [bacterium]